MPESRPSPLRTAIFAVSLLALAGLSVLGAVRAFALYGALPNPMVEYWSAVARSAEASDVQATLGSLRMAATLDRENSARALHQSIRLARQTGNREVELWALREFAARIPEPPLKLHNDLATALLAERPSEEELREAEMHTRSALELAPKQPLAVLNQGSVVYWQGDRARAYVLWRAVLRSVRPERRQELSRLLAERHPEVRELAASGSDAEETP